MVVKRKILISTMILIFAVITAIQVASAAPVLSIDPDYIEVLPGDNFTLDIIVDPDGTEVLGAQYDLYFDNTLLNVLEQNKGTFLSHDGTDTVVIPNNFNNTIGKIEYGETRINVTNGIITKGILSTITFQALKPGIYDLNPGNVILSNVTAMAIPDIQVNNGSITITAQEEEVNGYKGDKPLTTYRHDTTTGDLYFSHGDSYYSGKLWNNAIDPYTVNHQVTLPSGASVEFARLYNYWTWSACGTTGQKPTMTMTFEGNTISPDVQYDDRKGWGSVYDYPAGTWAYDVTSYITDSGEYTTTVRNTDSDPKSYVCMDGVGLLIVYNDPNGQQIEYWINEGADMLSSMDTSGGVTAEEATTTSLFSGLVDLASVESARLWTVVQSGGNEDNKLIFNAADWTGVYDATPYSDLDIDEARDVKDNLVASDNIAKIQAAPEATGGDYLMPSNAFLVLNIDGIPTPALSISANPTNATVGTPTDVTFTVTNGSAPVEGVNITLTGCADESGTTDATGVVVISVNATSAGTITATASKDGYTSATTTLTAKGDGPDTSSSVSLSVKIKPAISFTVTPDNINFGGLSPGETSDAHNLTLKNEGGSIFTVTALVSDNLTDDTLFKNGLLLNSFIWSNYSVSIASQDSETADASLSVPGDYMEVGQKQGELVFWAEA